IVHVAWAAWAIGPGPLWRGPARLWAWSAAQVESEAAFSLSAWAVADSAACPLAALLRLARRLTFSAVQPSSNWTWKRLVPRHRARSRPCSFFSSATPPSASHMRRMCAQTPVGVLQRWRAASASRLASVPGLLARGGEHRALRRDVGDHAQRGDVLAHLLAGESLVGGDRLQLGAGEAGARDDRRQRVALVTVGGLAQARHDAARLRVDGDLRPVDQVRALPGLTAQLGVRIAPRTGPGVAAAPLRGRSRPRLD